MLFGKELKKTVLSISFVILLVVLIALPISQGVMNLGNDIIREPQQGEDYGIHQKEIPELIMPAALQALLGEFSANEYVAYPIGFYKTVKLNDADREKMAEIIVAISNISIEDLLGYTPSTSNENRIEINLGDTNAYTEQDDGSLIISKDDEKTDDDKTSQSGGISEATLNTSISYEQFCKYMKQADELIGGGSRYSESNLLNFCYVAITYDEAKADYELVKDYDNFTGAYARYFCDYVGIVLSLLPVFIGVAICLKDSRSKMSELVFARKTSSFKLVMTRYFAILAAIMLPTLILAYISNMTTWGNYDGIALDYLAPLKYVAGWLLPSVMISAAVGMFFTELSGTSVAIAVQGLWWFIDMNKGATKLSGGFNLWQLTPRHNTLGKAQVFADGLSTLMTNRLLLAGIALCLVFATALIYEQRRRGRFDVYEKIKRIIVRLANCKSKSAA